MIFFRYLLFNVMPVEVLQTSTPAIGQHSFIILKIKIMTSTESNVAVLNDLIQINNDRIESYEKAAAETEVIDADLRDLFTNMANESREYVSELRNYIHQTGEGATDSTTVSGKIYRAWMDVKATFNGKDRKSILESCEFGEDAAQKAYKTALDNAADDDLSPDVVELIKKQKALLRESHNEIKRLRDNQFTQSLQTDEDEESFF